MPIESIQMPKAPQGWRPTSDQQQQIQRDRRLQSLSRDELYSYFNKPKTGNATRQGQSGQQRGGEGPQKRSRFNATGWVDQVLGALKGN